MVILQDPKQGLKIKEALYICIATFSSFSTYGQIRLCLNAVLGLGARLEFMWLLNFEIFYNNWQR